MSCCRGAKLINQLLEQGYDEEAELLKETLWPRKGLKRVANVVLRDLGENYDPEPIFDILEVLYKDSGLKTQSWGIVKPEFVEIYGQDIPGVNKLWEYAQSYFEK